MLKEKQTVQNGALLSDKLSIVAGIKKLWRILFRPNNKNMKPLAPTTLQDWIKALDELQLLVQDNREKLDLNNYEKIDINILGACTYLFHADRVLTKIRENFLTFRYRQEQFAQDKKVLTTAEFTQLNQAGQQCYMSIVRLNQYLQKPSIKSLYAESFINEINKLEMESNVLANAMHNFNQVIYRQEAIMQITQLEQNLLQSLMHSHMANKSIVPLNEMIFGGAENTGVSVINLRTKMQKITDPQDIALLNKLIEGYETLRKCYVIARKSVIKDTLDEMGEDVDLLMNEFLQRNEARIYQYLGEIYHKIESLRFSCNRDSRCSRNLAEKTKIVRHQLRRACVKHPLGQEFLKQIAVKSPLLDKASMKPHK